MAFLVRMSIRHILSLLYCTKLNSVQLHIFSIIDTDMRGSYENTFSDIVYTAQKPNMQVAQLSQRDRAAGWVSCGQKCNTIYSADNMILSSTTVT